MKDRRIPMADLGRQHAPLLDELTATFSRVAKSGRFILGPDTEGLEREVAALHGVAHAIGVTSGTDALLAGLMALGVGHGDEVVMTPMSFFATASVVARLGAKPVFADIGEDYLMDPRKAEALVGPKTKAMILVHLFGRVAEVPKVSVPIIEDAAQAVGAARVGKLGAMACLSFFPTKNLGALGDAGMILTDDGKLAEKLRQIRVQGQPKKYRHEILGGNFRIDELQSALLRVKLPHLAKWNEQRWKNAATYSERLQKTPLVLPRFEKGDVVHHYIVRAQDREALRAHLAEHGVDTDVYYPEPMYMQPALPGPHAPCPLAEAVAREVLALPVHAEVSEDDCAHVADLIVKFYG